LLKNRSLIDKRYQDPVLLTEELMVMVTPLKEELMALLMELMLSAQLN